MEQHKRGDSMSAPEVVDLTQYRRTRTVRLIAQQWFALQAAMPYWPQRMWAQPREEAVAEPPRRALTLVRR